MTTVPVWLLAVLLGLAGGVLGHHAARALATGGYRLDDERDLPARRASWWPPLVLALLWAALTLRLGADPLTLLRLPAYLLFAWLAVPLTWIDLDVHRLPDGLVLPAYPALAALVAAGGLAGAGGLGPALGGAAVLALVFGVLHLLSRGGLGLGDVKLAGLMGGLLGWLGPGAVLLGACLAFLLGGLVAVALLLLRRADRHTHVPFGPTMCAGTLLTVLLLDAIRSALLLT